jgi:hypothetical protein
VKGDFNFWFSHVTFPCTVIASILESWMILRLRARGYERRWWDATLYWRVAPKLGWSRFPFMLSMGIVLCGFAVLLFSK